MIQLSEIRDDEEASIGRFSETVGSSQGIP